MARDTKDIRDLKLKALSEAIDILKNESTPTSNNVTISKVIDLANELYDSKLPTKISPTSLKKPTSIEFKTLKEEIESYKKEHKKIKSTVSKKSIDEVKRLKNQIDNLLIEISKYYDDKLLLNEELIQKEKTIKKLKNERDLYFNKIKLLESQLK
ncbi:hypothetical protein [Arcobacter roscoffensis]|uniref:Uncharacterized protein n=1 Tax=Arcobacter roscoffensis TaxID=2961520 RepID=A0ABY5E8L4_9BACT|nr:hypothetical protein [Arcobacter roscoffensis]UTJ07106.1 hypothetical protein NJU99_03130 [Arcobacter roscoffensis]